MGAPDPSVAAVRLAVRSGLARLPGPLSDVPLLVGCSGGADSLALTAAALAVRGGGVHAAVVDHGLQDGSAERAAATAELLTGLGATAAVHRVDVTGPGGTEAAARRARYAALRAARPHPDAPVLLGHTLDDQAETVLLGLGRGSGARSLAGMRAWEAPWCRPLLGVRRTVTRAACAALGLPVWDDPHNTDPRFTRVRLRHEVLPLLEEVLAGGVAEALARTARQLREDGDALDAVAADLLAQAHDPAPPDGTVPSDPRAGAAHRAGSLRTDPLASEPPALRRRVLRAWLAAASVTALTDEHLRAADVLAGRGPDRGGVALPGGLELVRARGRLTLRPVRWPPPGG
ncbi:tRNA lysidine(34) synthetase TilS [Pseudonocardia sp. MH-G8]|uniref:tRNA lysidine(34) synthetase TilS n=1 Tax=Pseudonocardia sp. MH-G8 TaxID=1854588 RepID=UPI000BA05661|nr:tRNA lysidine(34) synthetase TilS [Pseudonocardia sp. MH-G8]OZM82706.1 tRNA lysidine(34) synthetase TilS [Pseudonocardia sp. MH-G8]